MSGFAQPDSVGSLQSCGKKIVAGRVQECVSHRVRPLPSGVETIRPPMVRTLVISLC
jgi:hypothetical protein